MILLDVLVYLLIIIFILSILLSLPDHAKSFFKRKHLWDKTNKKALIILIFCLLLAFFVSIRFNAFNNIQNHSVNRINKTCNFAIHKFGVYPLYYFVSFFIDIENTSIDRYISNESKTFINISFETIFPPNILSFYKKNIKDKSAKISSFIHFNQLRVFITEKFNNLIQFFSKQPIFFKAKPFFLPIAKIFSVLLFLFNIYFIAEHHVISSILTFPFSVTFNFCRIAFYIVGLPHYLKLKTIVTPFYNKYIGPKVNKIINWLSIFNITKYKYYKRFRQFMTDAFNQITQYLTQKSLFNKLKPTLISISKIITILTLLFNIYILFEFNVVSSIVLLPFVFVFYISRFIWLFLKIFVTFAVYIFVYFMIKLPLVIFNDIIGLLKTCCIPETAMKYYELINQMPIVVGDNRYPTEMVKYKPKFWGDPSIYDSPLYSDLHPPIFCESYEMMDQILENIYKVPDDLTYCLGGKNVIKRYSQLVTSALRQKNGLPISDFGNEKIYAIIRCPLDLGFQRNQHPNSLYNLVRERKVKIVFITMGSVYIKIKNIISSIINFFFPKGSVVDLPYGQQPVYIKTEWSGTLKPGEEAECHLNWQCMCDFDHGPSNDPRLTPFIIAGPEDLCEHYYWPKVQPNNSLRLSKTNELWDMNPEIPSLGTPLLKDVNGWNYPDAKNGGLIDPELFDMLNKNCDKKIVNIYGVSRSFNGQIEFGAYRSSIQSGIVAQLEDGTYICLEKSTSNY